MSRIEFVMSSPGTSSISAPMMTTATQSSQPRPAATYAGSAMRKDAAMVLKNGLTSSRSMQRVTKPMIRPLSPAQSQSRTVPPNTQQKPAAAMKLPR